jgi:hypothetical protein
MVDTSVERGPELPRRLAVPVVIAALVVAVVLAIIVAGTRSAWELLGAGRGLVEPEYYPLSAFVLMLATTVGQVVGWAGGTGIAYYVMTSIGFPRGWATWRLAMSLVYLGLDLLPLAVYHVIFGGPLLGLPREGLAEWLAQAHPDAYALLVTAHPFVDGSLPVFAVAFLGLLWARAEPPRGLALLTILALLLFATSLAVALSLGIHSTLVHIRM